MAPAEADIEVAMVETAHMAAEAVGDLNILLPEATVVKAAHMEAAEAAEEPVSIMLQAATVVKAANTVAAEAADLDIILILAVQEELVEPMEATAEQVAVVQLILPVEKTAQIQPI